MRIAMNLAEARMLINGNMRRLTRALRDAAKAQGEADTAERHRAEASEKAYQADRKVSDITYDRDSHKRLYEERGRQIDGLNTLINTIREESRSRGVVAMNLTTEVSTLNASLKLASEEIAALKALQTSKGKATALTEAQAKIKVLEDLLSSKGGSEPVIPISDVSRVLNLYGSSNKIQAIKLVRELTGLGLKEAKDVVEGNYKHAA